MHLTIGTFYKFGEILGLCLAILMMFAIAKIQKVRRSLKRSSRRVKSNPMMREDSMETEPAMDTQDMNHTAPLATLATASIDEDIIFESKGQKKRGGTFPRMAHFDVPEETPPGSQNGTLKANGTHRPQRQNGSLKGPWNRKTRGKGIPVKKEDTAKVLEMYLKRRSKSLNDAVLTREYFAQEKKKRVRSARNNTVSICSTLSTDSTTSEVHIQATMVAEATSDAPADKTVFSRASVTQQSFHEAMKCSIMEESSAMEQSADDELSSSDEQSPRSRSAPSTLRMQVHREPKEGMDTLKLKDKENGSATLTRDGYKRDSKKEPRRKRSFLDKAKNIMRSPSTSRKIIRTPSAVQRHEDKEKERLKEEKEKEKERQREEKEREKERLRKEKEEKELLDKKLKEYKEREKEKLKEMERKRKEEKEREKEWEKERERLRKEREKREKEELEKSHTRHHARTEVHREMKKTGFTARLKQSFRRSSRDRHHHHHHRTKDHIPSKPPELPPRPPELQQPKDVKPRRWPSFQFKRKSRKSASTPTDESGAGATTPSDTASMDFEYFASRADHTRSLNDAERRRLIIEMRQARRENSGNASDSQVLDRVQGAHPPLSQATSHDSFGSFASSEGSERPERPRTLAFRRTRAERAQRGLNNVIRLDSTTPGHVRRDVDTSFPVLPAALLADDLVRDGGSSSHPERGANGGGEGPDKNVTDSWTESGDGSDIPFEQRNQEEREEYFKRIADRLAMIGDQALADYEFNDSTGGAVGGQQRPIQSTCTTETYASCSASVSGATAAAGVGRDIAAEYVEIGQRIQTDVDGIQLRRRSQAFFPTGMLMGVIMNDTYQSFSNTMQSIVGQEVGMEQLAIVFKFTKVAVRLAHSMGKHASSIKDNSVRFISDRYAVWLDSQGGWGSVVTSDDSDSLHEESEID
ncbi:trichohyalin-like isoform X3 [Lytechinus variegatus]|uniref:trichohyalin-like isoform X3 n=1 Tax=Lytechinus variegatus TaxID=7654 RepID=UPI001BB18892|nr:trichohyalin-like isoform X3 [Lytechinus variegatus]